MHLLFSSDPIPIVQFGYLLISILSRLKYLQNKDMWVASCSELTQLQTVSCSSSACTSYLESWETKQIWGLAMGLKLHHYIFIIQKNLRLWNMDLYVDPQGQSHIWWVNHISINTRYWLLIESVPALLACYESIHLFQEIDQIYSSFTDIHSWPLVWTSVYFLFYVEIMLSTTLFSEDHESITFQGSPASIYEDFWFWTKVCLRSLVHLKTYL